jgi:hypothetical protein
MLLQQFNLRFAFALLTIASIVLCALSPPNATTWIAIVALASLVVAIMAETHGVNPIYYGCVTGTLAVFILIATYRPLFLCKTFFRGDSLPNFGDGLILEVFIYPVVVALIYAPMGAVIGASVGLIVYWSRILKRLSQPNKSANET